MKVDKISFYNALECRGLVVVECPQKNVVLDNRISLLALTQDTSTLYPIQHCITLKSSADNV